MQRRLNVFIVAAIALQCIALLLFNIRVSYFNGDDLAAVELLHQVDFWSYLAAPVDIHRIPLHRLVNYLLHTLFPMSFTAANFFMVGCHAASLIVLFRLLQRLNPSKLNLWLIFAYAFCGHVYIVMHWWSAGLHRLPYILGAIVSCYGFWRFFRERRIAFALLALACQVAAAGFFIKAVLIPTYWVALLFCCMNFRNWKTYWREYAVIGMGMLLSLAYVGWYMHANPHDIVKSSSLATVIASSLHLGFSTIAQMPLQIRLNTNLAPWINAAYGLVLGATLWLAPRTWRVLLMAFVVLAINLLIIAASSRATLYGALVMLITYYYAEMLFLMAIFATLLWQQLKQKMLARRFGEFAQHKRLLISITVVICALYAVAGWRNALIDTQPGPDEAHWESARYVRNLRHDMANIDVANLNLIDHLLPNHFRFGMLFPRPLPASMFLSWFGWNPQFQQEGKPLSSIDSQGHIRSIAANAIPVALQSQAGTSANGCAEPVDATHGIFFSPETPLALEHGYLQIDYNAAHDIDVQAHLLANNPDLRPFAIHFRSGSNQVLVDISRFWQFAPIVMTGLRLVQTAADLCVRGISVTAY